MPTIAECQNTSAHCAAYTGISVSVSSIKLNRSCFTIGGCAGSFPTGGTMLPVPTSSALWWAGNILLLDSVGTACLYQLVSGNVVWQCVLGVLNNGGELCCTALLAGRLFIPPSTWSWSGMRGFSGVPYKQFPRNDNTGLDPLGFSRTYSGFVGNAGQSSPPSGSSIDGSCNIHLTANV